MLGPAFANTPSSPATAPLRTPRSTISKRCSQMSFSEGPPLLWRESSLSMTRQTSPSHRIPNAARFPPSMSHHSQFLTLDLSKDICSQQGVGFAKARRPEHFIKGLGEGSPSPASYPHSQQALTISQLSSNPESPRKGAGRTIPNFSAYHKSYVAHSKHKPHQPQDTSHNPGPAHYSPHQKRVKSPSFSVRAVLRRFNEDRKVQPGPGAYTLSPQGKSYNVKGTLPLSKRTYLQKFEAVPSPSHYTIQRFLEHYD